MRWNSVGVLMKFLLTQKDAVDALTDDRTSKLKAYQFTETEWDIMAQLSPILDGFLQLTEKYSTSNVPLLHQVCRWSL